MHWFSISKEGLCLKSTEKTKQKGHERELTETLHWFAQSNWSGFFWLFEGLFEGQCIYVNNMRIISQQHLQCDLKIVLVI